MYSRNCSLSIIFYSDQVVEQRRCSPGNGLAQDMEASDRLEETENVLVGFMDRWEHIDGVLLESEQHVGTVKVFDSYSWG